MGVNANDPVKAAAHLRHHLSQQARKCSTICIAEAKNVSAGFLRCFQRSQSEIRVGVVAVKKMLGVVDEFFAVLLEETYGFRDQLQILFFGDPEGPPGVQVPAFAEN